MQLKVQWMKSFRKNTRAVSPAISAAILTAATIVMVLVATQSAYSALEHQQGESELQAIQKSFLTFDDAVRDVAWSRGSSMTSRFTCKYGYLEMVPNYALTVNISLPGETSIIQAYDNVTGSLRYNLSTSYLTLGAGYQKYLSGNSSTIIDVSTEDVGQLLLSQTSFINVDLNYRVRVSMEPLIGTYSYVDILIIKFDAAQKQSFVGDQNLAAKNVGISTTSYGPYTLTSNSFTIDVDLNGSNSSVTETFPQGATQAVFNVIVAEVQVSA